MKTLGTVKIRTLRDVAYENIKESIMQHELMPGETLTITKLSEKLGISPTPVREAVVRLSNEGILVYEANKRIKVSQITREDIREVYEARRLLETQISRKIVSVIKKNNGLKKKLETLKTETNTLIQTKQSPDKYAIIDLKLHELFLEMIENSVLKELFYLVGNKSLRIRTFVEATKEDNDITSQTLQPSAQEHMVIIKALIRCDEEQVVEAVETHLIYSEKRTQKSLNNYFKTH